MSRSVQLSLDGEQVCTPGSPRAKRGGTVVVISVMLFIGVGCGRARHRVRSWGVVTSQNLSRFGVSTYVTEVVPFGVARGCRETTRSLCRVWSRRMRVLRCACLPPFAACLRLVLSACGRVACACSGPALSSCTGPVEQVEPRHNSATASLLAYSKFAKSTQVLFRSGRRWQNAFGLSATAWNWSHAGPYQPW